MISFCYSLFDYTKKVQSKGLHLSFLEKAYLIKKPFSCSLRNGLTSLFQPW